jgi:hypothetical protein
LFPPDVGDDDDDDEEDDADGRFCECGGESG